jgi:hypothetical protein
MGIFSRKQDKEERIKENSRSPGYFSGSKEGDLICEEAIIRDKERFGRVRKSMMAYLREEYGRKTADRALWRVNRRKIDNNLNYRK